MSQKTLVERARRTSGINPAELAQRAHTSRTAISAYENGHKSPSLATLTRILDACGFEVDARPQVLFHDVPGHVGRQYRVPDRLPRLTVEDAFAAVVLPIDLNWSQPGREFRVTCGADRARLYEIVLQEGTDQDIQTYIDGALLVDIWEHLVLPRDLQRAWDPLISAAVGGSHA